MTFADLFAGRVTVLALIRELAPILMCAAGSFYAGYQHGRRITKK